MASNSRLLSAEAGHHEASEIDVETFPMLEEVWSRGCCSNLT